MQLKKKGGGDGGLGAVLRFLYRCLFNKKAVILYIFIIFLVGCLFGMGITGFFGTIDHPSPAAKNVACSILQKVGLSEMEARAIVLGILHENYKIPINYVNGIMSNPERMTIDIKNNDFLKLAYDRKIALENGCLLTSSYVPAKIRYKNQVIDVNMRLKGLFPDQWSSDKWSFRVKVRGNDAIFGMKIFAIQHPRTRSYINEWIFQKALEREGIVAKRYSFIDVTINGKYKGIYALEEHFDKRLIEHNKKRDGPIVRFDGDNIDAYQTNKIVEDPKRLEQFVEAKDLLESFRTESLTTSEVFDLDKLAKFMAISDVMSATHGTMLQNIRFYYNPITSKLEPIGNDGTPVISSGYLLCEYNQPYTTPFIKTVFRDPVFFEKYVQELDRVSQKSYLDDLFNELNDELQRNINIIHKDYPYYHLSKEIFYSNQNYIRRKLNPSKGLYAFFHANTTNKSVILEIGNIQSMPLEILDVCYHDSQIFKPREKTILQGRLPSEPVHYEKIEFTLPEGFNWSDQRIADLRLNYKLLGTTRLRNETVFPWSHLSEDFLTADFIRQKPNVEKFDFLFVDNATKRILVKHGDWELNDNLIIPAGYTVVCGEGTQLDLKNNATILSYSPLQFFGTEDDPVIIISSDSTGQGIAVLNAGEKSVFEKVVFKNLSAPSKHGWQLTGAITFYESPVEIDGCQLSDNKAGDDMLNIFRSEFEIKNTLFKHTLSDALDVDFGKGSISHSSFVDCGNDGLDFSGSVVDVMECFVRGAGDKGVSVGENSQININQLELKNCYVAAASKDRSQVNIENVKISACEVGFAVYQKKSEFGPSAMAVSFVDRVNVTTPYLVEEGSTLLVENQKIDDAQNQKNVWEILYGEK